MRLEYTFEIFVVKNNITLANSNNSLHVPTFSKSVVWIQTVWHSDSIPERNFPKKDDFEKKKIRRQQKAFKITQHAKTKTGMHPSTSLDIQPVNHGKPQINCGR